MSKTFENFLYGVCYYPEAWDASRHASDIQRIADCGFDYVRMGEGAWSYWEPSEGKFQFDLFDRVIDMCRKIGVRVIMGTPTYAAPAWVSHQYPEVLRWNYERIPMAHGSRRNLNYTSPKMLELSDRICTALAEHYKNDSQVVGWQLDNEFNCHMDVSYAPSDTAAFRVWLQKRYGTLNKLNDAWGTKFWSQTYTDWDQIDLPHPTATYLNPSLLLDEARFISDITVDFGRRQANILRPRNPDWFITHNGLFGNVDGVALTSVLDFFCHDQYPLFYPTWPSHAESLVQARSLSFPFGILEQQSGPGGQMQYFHRTPRVGQMRLWAWQSIAHGANLLSYFRWRTCPYGSEQHWHGLLDADDRDNRRITEAKVVGDEVKKLPKNFLDAPPLRAVAVLRDYENETNDRRINTYVGSGRTEYKRWIYELMHRHVPVDMVWPTSDLTGYKLVIVPHQKLMDDALLARLTAFVKSGGTLVLGAQSGSKDRNVHIVEATLPGLFANLAGVEVQDWTFLPDKETRLAVLDDGGDSIQLATFVERLKPTTARVFAHWKEEDTLLENAPAITLNTVGSGKVYYIGGYSPDAAVATLAGRLIHELELTPALTASPDVETVIRQKNGATYYCLLNHGTVDHQVHGIPAGVDLLTGRDVSSHGITLPSLEVVIVEVR